MKDAYMSYLNVSRQKRNTQSTGNIPFHTCTHCRVFISTHINVHCPVLLEYCTSEKNEHSLVFESISRVISRAE
jgi:hypothetical protein